VANARGNYEAGQHAFSMRLRFLTIRETANKPLINFRALMRVII
jgi:hypothetical protein